jgi:hypothetical protein
MSFSNCQFTNNRWGDVMFNVENTTLAIQHSTFRDNEVDEEISKNPNVNFTGCIFK